MVLMVWLLWPAAGQAQVYRCASSYSDTPCPGSTALTLSEPVQLDEDPTHSHVFLCRLGQRQFWSAQTCQMQAATIVYRHRVPRDWSWEQQWQQAERAWQQAQRQHPARAATVHPADTSQRAQQQRARPDCAQAEQRIRQLDAMARQGGTPRFMDRIRAERKEVRDWQFRADC